MAGVVGFGGMVTCLDGAFFVYYFAGDFEVWLSLVGAISFLDGVLVYSFLTGVLVYSFLAGVYFFTESG